MSTSPITAADLDFANLATFDGEPTTGVITLCMPCGDIEGQSDIEDGEVVVLVASWPEEMTQVRAEGLLLEAIIGSHGTNATVTGVQSSYSRRVRDGLNSGALSLAV